MKGYQDTARVVTPVSDTVILQDTMGVALERSTVSDLDSIMLNLEKRNASIAAQTRIVQIEPQAPPEPVVFHYFNNLFWDGFQPPENTTSLFTKKTDDLAVKDIHPVPVLENDNWQAARQSGKNYQLYLSRSDADYQVSSTQGFPSWVILIVLLSFLTITLLKVAYAKFFEPILNAILSHRETVHLYANRNSIIQNTSLVLQFLFLLNGGLFLFLAGSYLGIFPDNADFYILVLLSAGIFFLYQTKYLLLYILGFFFDQVKAFAEYVHSISLFNKLLGILLIPVTAGMAIMHEQYADYFIYAGISVIILSYLIQLARGVKIILDKGFSVFYLFLYLCALEIIPLLIVYKLLQA